MTKRALMGLILPAIIGASAAFAQQPTMNKLMFSSATTAKGPVAFVKPANKQISGAMVIPGNYNGVPTIPTGFHDNTQITSVTILEGADSIDTNAFYRCGGLTSITIPASVNPIGHRAFIECKNLTSVTFQGANTTIGPQKFDGDLDSKYKAGGAGTYTRSAGNNTWTKQGGVELCPTCGQPLPKKR